MANRASFIGTGQLPKFEEDKLIKDKIIEVLKTKDYEIKVEKDVLCVVKKTLLEIVILQ